MKDMLLHAVSHAVATLGGGAIADSDASASSSDDELCLRMPRVDRPGRLTVMLLRYGQARRELVTDSCAAEMNGVEGRNP